MLAFLRGFALLSVGVGAGLLLGIRWQQARTRELAVKAAKWDAMNTPPPGWKPASAEEKAGWHLTDMAYEDYMRERRNNG